MDKKPTSTRPDIEKPHFDMLWELTNDLPGKCKPVHLLRNFIEDAWVKSGRTLPEGLPKAYRMEHVCWDCGAVASLACLRCGAKPPGVQEK